MPNLLSAKYMKFSINRVARHSKRILCALKLFMFPGYAGPQLIFLHTPKCAGSSINSFLNEYLTSKCVGISTKINDIKVSEAEALEIYGRARRSRYVYGHMSIDTAGKIFSPKHKHFVFTFLRDPVERLLSLYNYSKSLSSTKLERAIGNKALSDQVRGMNQREFFGNSDFRFRFDLDNFMVRQFSGSLYNFPQSDEQWLECLDLAKQTLSSLNFVGFHDNFDNYFVNLLRLLEIPAPSIVPKRNVTRSLENFREKDGACLIDRDVRPIVDDLVKYDKILYEWARSALGGLSSES